MSSFSASGSVDVAGVGGGSVSGSGSAKWDWNKIRAGFTRINPGHYVRFDVDLSGKDTVYVSAITEDGILVADALARRADLSVIVGANAMIYDTKYGHVWRDTHDNFHGRRRRDVPDEGALVVRRRRALQAKHASDIHAINFSPQHGQGTTKAIGDNSLAVPIAAVAGVCLVVLMAGLAVVGIKRRNRKN